MKNKNIVLYEYHQFKSYTSHNKVIYILLLLLYLYFIYRYKCLIQEGISGNIISFLHTNNSLTNSILNNIASILFYTIPMIIFGFDWVRYMKNNNSMVKVRYSLSIFHFFCGELFLFIINFLWVLLNIIIFIYLKIPFCDHNQLFLPILFLTLNGNILFLFNLKDKYILGWIFILLSILLVIIKFPNINILIIFLCVIFIINLTIYKYDDINNY